MKAAIDKLQPADRTATGEGSFTALQAIATVGAVMGGIGRYKPNAPVFIDINRYDPLVPWTAANQLGRDWCALGADVQFWTNEQPPFLNKAGGQPRADDGSSRVSAACSGSPTASTACPPPPTAASSKPPGPRPSLAATTQTSPGSIGP